VRTGALVATRKCPHCAEKIQTAASVCKHCGGKVEPKSDLSLPQGCGAVLLLAVSGICMTGLCSKSGDSDKPTTTTASTDDGTVKPSSVTAADSEPCKTFIGAGAAAFGDIQDVERLGDWMCGQRFAVETTKGQYVCYMKSGRVASVYYMGEPPLGRVEIFRSPDAECSAVTKINAARPADKTVPAYKLVQRMKLIQGGELLTVIVKSLRPNAKVEELERVAKEIAQRENAAGAGQEVEIYCSEQALQADQSAKYSAAHPTATRCILGTLRDGTFHRVEH
jgi:hypothetical protein